MVSDKRSALLDFLRRPLRDANVKIWNGTKLLTKVSDVTLYV